MEEVPGPHQPERVVSGHDQVTFGHQNPFCLLKNRMWIFLKFNYMWKNYNVDTIRGDGHRRGVSQDGGTAGGGEDGLRFGFPCGCRRHLEPRTVLNADGAEHGQVVARTDNQQVISKLVGNQGDEASVLGVEHEASRHAPVPVGKAVAAVRKMLHTNPRAG